MDATPPTSSQSGTPLSIAGVVCLVLSVLLLLGATSFLGVLVLIDAVLPQLVYAIGLAQIIVSTLYALAGLLYIRRSSRANAILWVAIGCLMIELPIAVYAGYVAFTSYPN